MKSVTCSLALLLSAAFCFAQETKQEPKKGGCCETETKCDAATQEACGALGLICPKEGKCEGECRKICDKVGAALKGIRARVGELMQKEVGQKCACTVGDCKTDACKTCEAVKAKVLVPVLKEAVTARFKDLKTEIKHKVKSDDGKTEKEVVCTFLTGDTCTVCVNTMADASWKKLKELVAAMKKDGKCEGECPSEKPKSQQ